MTESTTSRNHRATIIRNNRGRGVSIAIITAGIDAR